MRNYVATAALILVAACGSTTATTNVPQGLSTSEDVSPEQSSNFNLLSSCIGFDCNLDARQTCKGDCRVRYGSCFVPCRKIAEPRECEDHCFKLIDDCEQNCETIIPYKPVASFQSYNNPTAYIRHQWMLGELTGISLGTIDILDSSFRVRFGLADSRKISFESVNFPGYFLRHQANRIKLMIFEDTPLFKADATFTPVPGLACSDAVSFESYNLPGAYIRHQAFHMWVHFSEGTPLLNADATYRITAPFACSR